TNQVRMDEALRVAEQAINANPEAPDGWAIMAMTLLWSRRYTESLAYAAQALEIDPNFVMVKAFQAQAYYRLDRAELATSTIDEAVAYLQQLGTTPDRETAAMIFRT